MISGTVTMTLAAMIGPQGISCWLAPDSSPIATGTVRVVDDDGADRGHLDAAAIGEHVR